MRWLRSGRVSAFSILKGSRHLNRRAGFVDTESRPRRTQKYFSVIKIAASNNDGADRTRPTATFAGTLHASANTRNRQKYINVFHWTEAKADTRTYNHSYIVYIYSLCIYMCVYIIYSNII